MFLSIKFFSKVSVRLRIQANYLSLYDLFLYVPDQKEIACFYFMIDKIKNRKLSRFLKFILTNQKISGVFLNRNLSFSDIFFKLLSVLHLLNLLSAFFKFFHISSCEIPLRIVSADFLSISHWFSSSLSSRISSTPFAPSFTGTPK